jgi:predicted glycosyltransferase
MDPLKILVEIGHPAHVHFFKHPIQIWEEWGHHVVIVTRDKEIAHVLLDEIGLNYIPLSKQREHVFFQAIELLNRWIKIFFLIKKYHIDVAISISGISTAMPAYLSRIVSITDQDTEDATFTNNIAFRFSDVVLTPTTFLRQAEFKNITTYNSFHELAYLHPNRFTPDKRYLHDFHIEEGDKYIFIRLVKWKAVHDIHKRGINEEHLRDIIQLLTRKQYKVLLSSERPLSNDFKPYLVKRHFSHIFHVLAFSCGYIGESPTMGVETAILGKPSILINSRVKDLGNMIELEKKYGILYNFEQYEVATDFIRNDFFSEDLQQKVTEGRRRLLEDKIDISAWIAEFVVNYCLDTIR